MKKALLFLSAIAMMTILFVHTTAFAKDRTLNDNGDIVRTVTIEEQNEYENKVYQNIEVTITAEEQNIAEKSSDSFGYIMTQNNSVVYFMKEQ